MPSTGKNFKVLIVDDQKDARLLLKSILKEYICLESDTAKDAIKKVKENQDIKIVILDNLLPDFNGIMAMPKMKAINPTLKFIMVTVQENITLARNAIKLGAIDYIVKPYKRSEIKNAMGLAIDCIEAEEYQKFIFDKLEKYRQKFGEIE